MAVTEADNSRLCIFLVDVDPFVGEMFETSGMYVRCFSLVTECLVRLCFQRCDLMIADLQMPRKNGLRLLEQVKEQTPWVPVLIVTAYGNIPTAVRAIKGGAFDFIQKPFRKAYLMQKVNLALQQSRMVHPEAIRHLTPKEVAVFRLIVEGRSNREIAEKTNRHVKTIEAHRAGLMQKLGARNVIELLKLGVATGLVSLPAKKEPVESALQANEHLPKYLAQGDMNPVHPGT